MVLTAPTDTALHRTAAMAAASVHLHFEASVVEAPLDEFTGVSGIDGLAVVASTQGVVEWFPHDDQPLESLARPARSVAGDGWTVAVLVPTARMGEAHRALRGTPVVLQPWWLDGDTVRFGGPEVP